MAKQSVDEEKITKYLLGDLPDTESEQFDEMSVSSNEFADQLRVVEDDLIDAYVRGELSGETLERFQLHYLASPMRQEKVSFARTFLTSVDRSNIGVQESRIKPPVTDSHRRAGSLRFPQMLGWAVAGFLLLITGYFLFQNMNLKNQIEKTLAEQNSLKQQEAELQNKLQQQQASDFQTKNELAAVQKRLAELQKQIADENRYTPKTSQSDVKLIAMNLLPQKRSITKISTIMIPEGNVNVVFTLELEADDFSLYKAALRNPANNAILWESGKLQVDKNSNTVKFKLPAKYLKTGNYVWELSGFTDNGERTIVSTYSFRVLTS